MLSHDRGVRPVDQPQKRERDDINVIYLSDEGKDVGDEIDRRNDVNDGGKKERLSAPGTRASFSKRPSSLTMFGRNMRKLLIRPRASRLFTLVFGFSIDAISLPEESFP